MKRFFLSCVIVITALFIGFTVWYCVQNNEKIVMASNSNSIKLNVGEKFNMSDIIVHTLPHNDTVLNVEYSVGGVLEYDKQSKQFEAKKIGAIVLTITPSNAKFGPFVFDVVVGDGSSAQYPYFIRTADELCSIGKGGNLTTALNYELIADIYLTGKTWTPITTYGAVFNGGNHVIYDMNVTSATNAGLFGTVEQTGVVKNVTFINAKLQGNFDSCGVVAGKNYGTISLCQVIDSNITNGGTYTGAIAGANILTPLASSAHCARIGMCGVESTTITGTHKIGGITALNEGSIVENCYVALNSVNGSSTGSFGGIVGENKGYKCNAYEKPSTIYKCHAYVKAVSGTTVTSGIAFLNSDASTTAPNDYSYNYFCMPTSNYIDSTQSASADQIAKVTDSQLKQKTTYNTWDFDKVWKMSPNYAVINYTMPYVTSVSDVTVINGQVTPTPPDPPTPIDPDDPTPPTPTYTNEIRLDNFYEKMEEIKANPNSGRNYVIKTTFQINLQQSQKYFPLGTASAPYTCQIVAYNNNYITISGLTLNNVDYASMFGYVGNNGYISGFRYTNANVSTSSTSCGVVCAELSSGALIQDCQVSNSHVNGNKNIGAICGYSAGNISNVTASSCTVSGTTNSSTSVAGGIVGHNSNYLTKAKSLNATINGYYAGGLAGLNAGTIAQSVAGENNIGSVSGVFAGGLTAINQTNANINNCVVGTQMVTTSSSQNTCGLAYKLEEGSVINNCFSYATFSGTTGERYCDTSSAFRSFAAGIWSVIPGNYTMGTIQNSLMLNKSNITILGTSLPFDSTADQVTVTESQARGSDNFAKFYENGFSSSVWKFISNQYPTIR